MQRVRQLEFHLCQTRTIAQTGTGPAYSLIKPCPGFKVSYLQPVGIVVLEAWL